MSLHVSLHVSQMLKLGINQDTDRSFTMLSRPLNRARTGLSMGTRAFGSTSPTSQYDLVVIGGGPGGYVAAIKVGLKGIQGESGRKEQTKLQKYFNHGVSKEFPRGCCALFETAMPLIFFPVSCLLLTLTLMLFVFFLSATTT